jgi:hypothetical protein
VAEVTGADDAPAAKASEMGHSAAAARSAPVEAAAPADMDAAAATAVAPTSAAARQSISGESRRHSDNGRQCEGSRREKVTHDVLLSERAMSEHPQLARSLHSN